jgi:hypothetical protein
MLTCSVILGAEENIMDVDFENRIRIFVYQHFVTRGRAPAVADVADALAVTPVTVRDAFVALAEEHVLVLHPDSGELWMAMPFSAVPTPFRVRAQDSAWWANCAWDALGILAALDQDGEIATQCANSGADLTVTVHDGALDPDASGVIHFAVPAARWWDDIGYT